MQRMNTIVAPGARPSIARVRGNRVPCVVSVAGFG